MKNTRKEKYFISNEKMGTTVAIMIDIPMGIVEESYRRTSKMTAMIVDMLDKKLQIDSDTKNPMFETEVKCVSGDKFDKRIGKDIAGCVSDKKYHIAMMKRYKRILNILHRAINEIETVIAFHNKKVENINTDLERFYK